MKVLIQEASFSGKILDEIFLEIEQEITSVAEIIANHVIQQVTCSNNQLKKQQKSYQNDFEQELNLHTSRVKNRALFDTEKEIYKANSAFQNKQMIVMIDNKQAQSLEEEVFLNENTTIRFLRLMPLIGG
jgi:hypothetical protein